MRTNEASVAGTKPYGFVWYRIRRMPGPDEAGRTMKGRVGMTARRRDFLLLVTLAAAVATPAAGQTVAPAQRRQQQQPAGRRLHQSDLEAARGRNREEARRDFPDRRDLSDRGQPVL